MAFLLVGIGGFSGAISRFYLSRLVDQQTKSSFPTGLLVINVIGCFMMGVLMSYLKNDLDSKNLHILFFLSFGFLASFTTFSSFGYETIRFLQSGQYAMAVTNVFAHVGLGLIATILGVAAVELWVNLA